MAHTTFTNGVTLTEAAWFQDVDTVAYTLFGNGTSYTGVLTLAGTTQSTSTTTGQAIISGGMGLAKNLWVGGTGNFAGAVTLQAALTYGGVALSNAVTGTGNMVLSAGPTFTGTLAAAAITASSTLGVTGDFAVNTNKFTVTASSGNVLIAGILSTTGTLNLSGDFNVNTNKFNITATSGNTAIAGTLGVTGTTTLRTTVLRDTTPETNNTYTLGTDALRWGDLRTQVGQCYGAFSKGSGTFDIEHPILEGKRLRHSFVEGPRYDLIYRGNTRLIDGVAFIDLDKDCVSSGGQSMTPGTFVALTRDTDLFLQNNDSWVKVRGEIVGSQLKIISETPCNDNISWMVVAERQDDNVKASFQCDDEARLILEYDSSELKQTRR